MNKSWTNWLALLIIIAWVMGYRGCYIGLAKKPEKPEDAPDLVEAFSQSDNKLEAKEDALLFSTMCYSIAEAIEYDGNLKEPRLRTGRQLDQLRRWTREYLMEGKSFGVKYPSLPPVIKRYLDKELGTEAGPLTEAKRKRWIRAFRKLGEAAEYAGKV